MSAGAWPVDGGRAPSDREPPQELANLVRALHDEVSSREQLGRRFLRTHGYPQHVVSLGSEFGQRCEGRHVSDRGAGRLQPRVDPDPAVVHLLQPVHPR